MGMPVVPAAWEAEARGLLNPGVQGQLGPHREILAQKGAGRGCTYRPLDI
jgi:hypothetical protein